ncbi:DNA repair and recombination protein Rad51 [Helicosporidium sp. ATCC 50920]|nr:DNA repair and recombination protein Rad51 [Helicosporidium sp. ATCC 50920]|eukprot:KDD74631.1 DNA repair and recombination protein Rad51 [Helicosporidium sp. ATCC 50920]
MAAVLEAERPVEVVVEEEECEEVISTDAFLKVYHIVHAALRLLIFGDLKKAKEAGYNTCESMLMQPKRKLFEIKGLSEAKVEKMLDAAKKSCPNFGIMSAKDFEVQITEIFGEWRTGKTQLCHTLCVTTQMGVGAGRVAYFDTEGTFRPERVRPIAERFHLDGDAVLSNVLYVRAYTFDQQYGGELAERQQKLGALMNRLRKLADEFNIAVLITNQVISDPSGGAMFVVDPKKPVGGHVMAHASTIRLSVRKGKAEQRLMKVVDSPNLPEAEASYAIAPEGIVDYKD